MAKLICSFAERVLIGITGFLLVLALIVGMSQNVLADPVLGPLVPPVNCDPTGLTCSSCGNTGSCICKLPQLPDGSCPGGCNPPSNNCSGCTCQTVSGSCGCYK